MQEGQVSDSTQLQHQSVKQWYRYKIEGVRAPGYGTTALNTRTDCNYIAAPQGQKKQWFKHETNQRNASDGKRMTTSN